MTTSTIPPYWRDIANPELKESIERLYDSDQGPMGDGHVGWVTEYIKLWVNCPTFTIPMPRGVRDRDYFLAQLEQCNDRASLLDFLVDFVADTGIDPM
jgi:hypothetical protein